MEEKELSLDAVDPMSIEKDEDGAVDYSSFSVKPVENSVIELAVKGDKDAFERLFMGTYRYVFAVVRRYLKNDEDALDAIQDTYVAVLKGIGALRNTEAFYTWLYRIAQNSAFAVWNRVHPGEDFTEYDQTVADPQSTDETEHSAVSADVTAVLKTLPTEQAELLVWLYYDCLTVTEIAKMQGLPRTTVSNRVRAAKKALKEKLKLRGIDKPIYSGEFISMLSNALRYAIGTQLLSMAVAQEILHNVTSSKDVKSAAVIINMARKQRNSAALKIAGMLIFGAVLIVLIIIMLILLFSGVLFGARSPSTPTASDGNSFTSSYDEHQSSIPSDDKTDHFSGSSSSSSSSLSGSSSDESSSLNTSSDKTSSKPSDTGSTSSSNTSSKPTTSQTSTSSASSASKPSSSSATSSEEAEEQVEFLGSPYNSETFGRERIYGLSDCATVGNTVYSIENGDLVSKNINGGASTVHIKNFTETYGSSVGNLNVYDGKVYWWGHGKESSDFDYYLNRCNLDGTGYYSKKFAEFEDFEALWYFTVAKDGVWFCTWDHDYSDEYMLYRTDYDFNVQRKFGGVVDFALVGDKIYYLEGSGNVGTLYSANRNNFGNQRKISSVSIKYGGIWSYGDYIVLEPSNGGGMENSVATDIIIIDTTTDKIVGRIKGTDPRDYQVISVSGKNGGTVVYSYSGNKYSYTVQTRKTEKIS